MAGLMGVERERERKLRCEWDAGLLCLIGHHLPPPSLRRLQAHKQIEPLDQLCFTPFGRESARLKLLLQVENSQGKSGLMLLSTNQGEARRRVNAECAPQGKQAVTSLARFDGFCIRVLKHAEGLWPTSSAPTCRHRRDLATSSSSSPSPSLSLITVPFFLSSASLILISAIRPINWRLSCPSHFHSLPPSLPRPHAL